MTAAITKAHPGGRDQPRADDGSWTEWVQRGAAGAPRPLRIFFEAELGFEAWLPSFRATAGSSLATARRRPRSLSRHDQVRLAERLLRYAVALAVLGGITASNLRSTGRALVVDRLVGGGLASAEALSAGESTGTGAVKGEAADAVGPPTPRPPAEGAADVAAAVAVPPPVLPPAPSPEPPPPTIPAQRGALPVGKGMWIWLSDHAEGGNAAAIVARAQASGLTHLYVRTASLRQGFYAGPFLDQLLPLAHAAHLRVYAWDFPYLDDVEGDVNRALQAITHLTPDGHRVDGYVADIELRSMGVNVTPITARAFGAGLRKAVGPNYPLIACVPRPSPSLVNYPYAEVVASFDAIAPMVYWLGRDPVADLTGALADLAHFGKPVIPVGQAYDGGAEGGPAGVPPREQLIHFMQAGDRLGAAGVSWWSWQHADQEAWDAIRDAAEFRLPAAPPEALTPGQVHAYQTLLTSLGFPTPIDGVWGPSTTAAVQAYQQAARLPVTGVVDDATRAVLLTPFAPPIQPQG